MQFETHHPAAAARGLELDPRLACQAAGPRIDGDVDHVVVGLEARRTGPRLALGVAQRRLHPAVPAPEVLDLEAHQATALLLAMQKAGEAMRSLRRDLETDELAEIDLLLRRRIQLQKEGPEVLAEEPAGKILLVERIAQGVEQDAGLDAEGAPLRAVLPGRVTRTGPAQGLGLDFLDQRAAQQGLCRGVAGDDQHRLGEGLRQSPFAGKQLELTGLDVARRLEPRPAAADEDHLYHPLAAAAHRDQDAALEVEGRETRTQPDARHVEGQGGVETGRPDLPQQGLGIGCRKPCPRRRGDQAKAASQRTCNDGEAHAGLQHFLRGGAEDHGSALILHPGWS